MKEDEELLIFIKKTFDHRKQQICFHSSEAQKGQKHENQYIQNVSRAERAHFKTKIEISFET